MSNTPRKFSLAALFTAVEMGEVTREGVYLTALSGWEEHRVEIITKPKLFGKGSYVVEKRVPEQEITATVQVVTDSSNVWNLFEATRAQMDLLGEVTATRVFEGGKTDSKSVYITALSELDILSDSSAQFTLTLLEINP